MTYNIEKADGNIDRIDCTGIQISPDGSLICTTDQQNRPPVAVYNGHWWRKVEPASIQSGKGIN